MTLGFRTGAAVVAAILLCPVRLPGAPGTVRPLAPRTAAATADTRRDTVRLKADFTHNMYDDVPAGLDFAAYRDLLARVVHGDRVDYGTIVRDRRALDAIVEQFAAVPRDTEQGWRRPDRMAFWINAYNLLTLRAIVDHYPIRGSLFSRSPRNSIRQIDGVWTTLKWRTAGREVTLDQIEHGILRPEFGDARVHMAVNCASKGCPPLRGEPYSGADLDRQLDEAARRYLASPAGARVSGDRLLVSRIFEWYGDDFVEQYAAMHPGTGRPAERAIQGFVEKYGPAEAAAAAKAGSAVRFLDYDWSLNDVS